MNTGKDSYEGRWWVPGKEDEPAGGTLRFGEDAAELRLYQSLPVHQTQRERKARFDPAVLHGRSMGTLLTLLDNTELSASVSNNGPGHDLTLVLHTGTVLIGPVHLKSDGECQFNRASFRLSNLDEFANRRPFKHSSEPELIEFVESPSLEVQIPGAKISLYRSLSTLTGTTAAGFTSRETIELELDEPTDLDDMDYKFIRPLRQLLTLATGIHCTVIDLKVGNSDGDGKLHMGQWPLHDFSVRHSLADLIEPANTVISPLMRFGLNRGSFTLPQVDFATVVARWFQMQETLAGACDLVFSLHANTGGYLEQKMFTIASAVEGLHRKLNPGSDIKTEADKAREAKILGIIAEHCPEEHEWLKAKLAYSHTPSYAARIKELLQAIDHLLATVVNKEDKWVRQLGEARNSIGHARASDGNSFRQTMAMLYSAQLLAEIVLMRELGFSDSDCRAIVERDRSWSVLRATMTSTFPNWFR